MRQVKNRLLSPARGKSKVKRREREKWKKIREGNMKTREWKKKKKKKKEKKKKRIMNYKIIQMPETKIHR